MHPKLLFIAGIAILASACGADVGLGPEATAVEQQLALVASETTYPLVSAGEAHTCVVGTDATIDCWGDDGSGRATPPEGTFVGVSAGRVHTCGVRTDGTLACWGSNASGQASPPAGTFTRVSAGGSHSCAIRTDGTLACWGFNGNRQATPPAGMFKQVAAGGFHTCAIREDGTVACWGYNGQRQASPPAGTFTKLSAGAHGTCAVGSSEAVVCWGLNKDGQATPPVGSFKDVGASHHFACAVKADGSLACWGDDAGGRATPPTGSFSQVSAGLKHACAVRTDQSIACWGGDELQQPPAAPPSDVTAPEITPVVSGTLGGAGWYVDDVHVSWTVVDAESGVASSEGCASSVVHVDTDSVTFTCSATNGAGLSASASRKVKRDATVPSVSWAGNAGKYRVDASISITCNPSDPTSPGSGLASHDCRDIEAPAYTFPLGTSSFAAAAADTAGLEVSGSVAFEVVVTTEGLCELARRFVSKAGVANAMCKQLEAAHAAHGNAQSAAKHDALQSFRNLVKAQTGKSVTAADAEVLLRLADAL